MNEGLRAEAIFFCLKRARAYTHAFPSWNVSIQLNGMNNCVDVKVFEDNQAVHCLLDPEEMLFEMLCNVVDFLEDRLGPLPSDPSASRPFESGAGDSPGAPQEVVNERHVDWHAYATCARCGSVMGVPCFNLTNGDVMVKPHVGRMLFRKEQEMDAV